MKKILIIALILLIIGGSVLYLTNYDRIELVPVRELYEGEEITVDDFKVSYIYSNGLNITSKILSFEKEKLDSIYAAKVINVNLLTGNYNLPISQLIKVKSFEAKNIPTEFIKAGEKYEIPRDFKAILTYQDNTQKILYKNDLTITQKNNILQHGDNIITFQYNNIIGECAIHALAHPVIQSETYPMYYYDLDTTIEITKERFQDTDCFVAHVITTDPLALKTTFGPNGWGSHCYMSDVMEYRHAILMINGDYTDCGYGGWGPIVRDSEVVNFRPIPNAWGKTLGIKNDGHFYYVQSSLYDEIKYNDLRDAWTFNNGFTILNGERIIKNDGAKHPRTFIGEVLRDDGKLEYYLVVADGRREDSRGFCHDDESAFLFEKGCYIAYNLDGGGSSEMMFDGKILNTPSDGHERLDHDFIYFALWDGI